MTAPMSTSFLNEAFDFMDGISSELTLTSDLRESTGEATASRNLAILLLAKLWLVVFIPRTCGSEICGLSCYAVIVFILLNGVAAGILSSDSTDIPLGN